MRKKLIAVLLTCAVLVGCAVFVGAAGGARPVAGAAQAAKDVVTLTLYAKGGSNAVSGSFVIRYDAALQLQNTDVKASLADANTEKAGEVQFAWTGEAKAEDQALLTLTFAEAPKGSYTFPVEKLAANGADYLPLAETDDFYVDVKVPCYSETCPSLVYSDVPADAWFHDAVDFVTEQGVMSGMGGGKFAPQGTLTRAMVMRVLASMEEFDPIKYTMKEQRFTDVNAADWFAPYVEWAYQKGIAAGYADGSFKPNEAVTREELVAFFYRYNALKGAAEKADPSVYNSFTDTAEVSSYAVEAMQWATASGLIQGMGNGKLAPKGTSNRAQAATIIANYMMSME